MIVRSLVRCGANKSRWFATLDVFAIFLIGGPLYAFLILFGVACILLAGMGPLHLILFGGVGGLVGFLMAYLIGFLPAGVAGIVSAGYYRAMGSLPLWVAASSGFFGWLAMDQAFPALSDPANVMMKFGYPITCILAGLLCGLRVRRLLRSYAEHETRVQAKSVERSL
jgi:hypothetical protein